MNLLNFVSKGWGFEKWIVNNDRYCGKLLYFVKGKRCSLHYHKLKDETFYIQSGQIMLEFTDVDPIMKSISEVHSHLNTITLKRGDCFHIPPGRIHRMTAIEDTELFEFSTQHLDEDSYRLIKGD